jgi:hypothetical protein
MYVFIFEHTYMVNKRNNKHVFYTVMELLNLKSFSKVVFYSRATINA